MFFEVDIDDDDVPEAIKSSNFTPDEVFDDNDLVSWAEDNGMVNIEELTEKVLSEASNSQLIHALLDKEKETIFEPLGISYKTVTYIDENSNIAHLFCIVKLPQTKSIPITATKESITLPKESIRDLGDPAYTPKSYRSSEDRQECMG